jgi:putative acetyltransferase
VIAKYDSIPVGCAGIFRISALIGEIKRMFVDPGLRGRKIASRIMLHLEEYSRSMGLKWVILGTGPLQPAAV